MLVFKFGGASIGNIDGIKNVAKILYSHSGEKVFTIISAMGKTTNALEKVAEAFYAGKSNEALMLFQQIKTDHLAIATQLLVQNQTDCQNQLNDFFTETEWLLHDKPVRTYDYYYDQIVCCGELLSTTIVSYYLLETGMNNYWLDVRDILRTDDNFREANLNWEYSAAQTDAQIKPLFSTHSLVITQGFIGSTADNESTTFGREGSDYSAAIFANLLNAESQTIWKDVPSVMNADPKQFANAIALPELSYYEVMEMAFYGAQVIHPKTIKPLHDKKIPLLVKCFLNPALAGTIISSKPVKNLPPIYILKKNQVLITYRSKDYSFVGEHAVRQLYQLMEQLHIQPNITQIGATSFTALYDNRAEKIQQLSAAAETFFDVQVQNNLALLTIRHYNKEILAELTKGKKALLTQQTPETIQIICEEQND